MANDLIIVVVSIMIVANYIHAALVDGDSREIIINRLWILTTLLILLLMNYDK